MGEIIEGINIEELAENLVFDNELITSRWRTGMRTVRREPDSGEIRYFLYDFDPKDELGRVHNNGYGELYPGDKFYDEDRKELQEAGLW